MDPAVKMHALSVSNRVFEDFPCVCLCILCVHGVHGVHPLFLLPLPIIQRLESRDEGREGERGMQKNAETGDPRTRAEETRLVVVRDERKEVNGRKDGDRE